MNSHSRRAVASAALLLLIVTVITFPLTPNAATQTAAPACAQVPDGIVSWYPGEPGVEGNAEDISGNNDGTELGGVTHPPGKVGNAFGLDGVDDQVEVPENPDHSLDLNTLTIDAWINRSSTADARIVDKITAGGADGYLLDIVNNRLRLIIGGANVVGETPIETGTYTLVAGTFDGTNLRVYVNGTLDGTTTVESTTTPANDLPLHIGTNSTADGNFFAGVIDELELFNRALTQDEIQSLVNADSTGKCRPAGIGQLIISEFRFRGLGATRELLARASSSRHGGASKPSAVQDSNTDEFIELYNNSDSDITVATTDGSAGWALAYGSDSVAAAAAHSVAAVPTTIQTLVVIDNGTIIPARAHLLVANSLGYSLGGYPAGPGSSATPDLTYTNDIPDDAGVALFATANQSNFSFDTRLDAAGFASPQQEQLGVGGKHRPSVLNSLFYEDTPIQNHVSANAEHSFIRKLDSGRPQDTDNNASDFQLIATDPTGLTDATLGAPGPENLTSPIQRSLSVLKSSLVEPCASSAQPPNRVRDFTSDPANHSTSGTLLLRRRFTNTTNSPVTRLRFRVVDITTLSNPVAPDDVADLRAISSGVTPVTVMGAGCTPPGASIDVQGLTLEEPPAQPNGGGLNSTLSAGTVTLDAPLAASASIDLNFLFGVERPGTFRAFVLVEATFDSPPPVQNFRPRQKGASTGERSSPQAKPKARPRAKH